MISPLTQRQIFQTMNVEAVRQAHEVSEVLQREAARQKAVDDRLLEGLDEVHVIPHSERIRTEERKGSRKGGGYGESEEEAEEGSETAEDGQAGPAEPHLDLLA